MNATVSMTWNLSLFQAKDNRPMVFRIGLNGWSVSNNWRWVRLLGPHPSLLCVRGLRATLASLRPNAPLQTFLIAHCIKLHFVSLELLWILLNWKKDTFFVSCAKWFSQIYGRILNPSSSVKSMDKNKFILLFCRSHWLQV